MKLLLVRFQVLTAVFCDAALYNQVAVEFEILMVTSMKMLKVNLYCLIYLTHQESHKMTWFIGVHSVSYS